MYNIGDLVIVRTDLEAYCDYDGWYFAQGMTKYRGNVYEIIAKIKNRYVINGYMYALTECYSEGIHNDKFPPGYWVFSDAMLDPAMIVNFNEFEKMLLE